MNAPQAAVHTLAVEGLAFWASGLPGLQALRGFLAGEGLPQQAPARPTPQMLAPNERRRAPDTVALALEVAQAACEASGRDPARLASVFASTHGDLAITDYMCATLARAPLEISPTRFHNSVHNAAAGYWTMAAGCHAPATAISAYDASFALALVEAAAQVACERLPVLLVAYDAASPGPLRSISRSEGLLAAALVLAPCGSRDESALSAGTEAAGTPQLVGVTDTNAPRAAGPQPVRPEVSKGGRAEALQPIHPSIPQDERGEGPARAGREEGPARAGRGEDPAQAGREAAKHACTAAPLRLSLSLEAGDAPAHRSALQARLGENAMAPMLPLVELLASGSAGTVLLHAGTGIRLRVTVHA